MTLRDRTEAVLRSWNAHEIDRGAPPVVDYDCHPEGAVDVTPARVGRPTTMVIRTLADALPGTNEPYSEIDRLTLKRIAGRSRTARHH